MEYIHNQSKLNFESTTKWLYLGTNTRDSQFAKVGITMGDLTSRSSSSESPGYHLFCAFKCRDNISRSELERIEQSALNHLEKLFTYSDGSTKRASHHESERISECFYDVNFLDLFGELHYYLYENHCNYFIRSSFENNERGDEGDFLDCEFNRRNMSLSEVNRYIRMILQ